MFKIDVDQFQFEGFVIRPYFTKKEWFAQHCTTNCFLHKNKLSRYPHSYKGLGKCISAVEKFVTKK